MPSLTAVAQPDHGRVFLQASWGDIPAVLYAAIYRVDADGEETPVRTNTFTTTDSDYMQLSGGTAIMYDTEAPMDTPFTYITRGLGSSSTATAGPITMLSSNHPWLKSPLHPWQDKRLNLSMPLSSPFCDDEDAVFFAAMDVEARPGRTSVFPVDQRKNPIPAPRVRGGITSSLRLISRTFPARDQIIQLNESGDPLLFQTPQNPDVYGIPDRYMSVGDYTVARLSPNHKQPWRAITLPHVEIDRPAGLSDGVLGNRWADICDYGTFGAATAAGLTWTKVLMGYASTPPTNPDFRLYSDIPIDFATYGAIPLGGRTYGGILEGL